jgi:hypothetical protein
MQLVTECVGSTSGFLLQVQRVISYEDKKVEVAELVLYRYYLGTAKC